MSLVRLDAQQVASPEIVNPVAILLDNSGSMAGRAISELNSALAQYAEQTQRDTLLRASLFTALFTLSDEGARMQSPFAPPALFVPPQLQATQCHTPLCAALCQVVEAQIAFRRLMRERYDRDTRHGWVFAITDGLAGDRHLAGNARRATQVLAREHELEVFLIGCGADVDEELLRSLAQPGRPPKRLASIEHFRQFFQWLYQSVRIKSQTEPGTSMQLPATDVEDVRDDGWAAKG